MAVYDNSANTMLWHLANCEFDGKKHLTAFGFIWMVPLDTKVYAHFSVELDPSQLDPLAS